MNHYLSQIATRSAGAGRESHGVPTLTPEVVPVFPSPSINDIDYRKEETSNRQTSFPPSGTLTLKEDGKNKEWGSNQTIERQAESGKTKMSFKAPSYLEHHIGRLSDSIPEQKRDIEPEKKLPAVETRETDAEKPLENRTISKASPGPGKPPFKIETLALPASDPAMQLQTPPQKPTERPARIISPYPNKEDAQRTGQKSVPEATFAPRHVSGNLIEQAKAAAPPPAGKPITATPRQEVTPKLMPVNTGVPYHPPVKKAPDQPRIVIGRLTVQVLPPAAPAAPKKQWIVRKPPVQPSKKEDSQIYKLSFGLGQL